MKNSFYFPHDFNAIQDPKMMTLLFECGLFGIGAFWVIIEIMHQQPNGMMSEEELGRYLDFYGKQGSWSDEMLSKCKSVMISTGLLVVRDGVVTSNRVRENIKLRNSLIIKKKGAAESRWKRDAHAMHVHCTCNADAMLGKERKGKNITTTTKDSFSDERFASFWKAYPKKIGKGAAEKAWKKITALEAVFEKILWAVAAQKNSEQWTKDAGQYIPHPATWLNQRRWEDEIAPPKPAKEVPHWSEVALTK